ncbi:hypothetical protein Zmor_016732 [Zophobas morio]|uniref:Uncharacterized protein n=1 Tax=Zophobas morio TaxID=2755281 RepID=A0AA38MBY9_9CUCU|nr:hypothetical protein Zmor_016732 [Zophobas morio]
MDRLRRRAATVGHCFFRVRFMAANAARSIARGVRPRGPSNLLARGRIGAAAAANPAADHGAAWGGRGGAGNGAPGCWFVAAGERGWQHCGFERRDWTSTSAKVKLSDAHFYFLSIKIILVRSVKYEIISVFFTLFLFLLLFL